MTTEGGAFRYPYEIATVLEPWRERLGDQFDEVVALLADRDRALEDSLTAGSHSHDGEGADSTITHPSDDNFASASGFRSNAWGYQSVASGDYSMAFGPSTEAAASFAAAFGPQAWASGLSSVAVGNSADAIDDWAVAIGANAIAGGSSGIAIGNAANTSAASAMALGRSSTADDLDATAVGANTDADAFGATAIGSDAAAHAQNSTALGTSTAASHQNATALGYDVGTTGTDQVTIGQYRFFQGVPNSATTDSHLSASQLSFYLDEGSNLLKGRAKYSDETLHTFQMGTAAPANEHYLHVQGTPASSWPITHNLGWEPNVTVIDSANDEVFGTVNHVSVNSLTVTFSGAFSGRATLS